jgi:hypothetical protein
MDCADLTFFLAAIRTLCALLCIASILKRLGPLIDDAQANFVTHKVWYKYYAEYYVDVSATKHFNELLLSSHNFHINSISSIIFI